ncbi:MAG: hypothetical protein ACOCT9_01285 [archaeon]
MSSKKPFKEKSKLKDEIEDFLKDNQTEIQKHGKRLGTYFEIACYNYVVKYYEKYGFRTNVRNLNDDGEFKYMLNPTGYPKNFSYFHIERTYNYSGNPTYKYEIRHNVRVQAKTDKNIFVNPDIVICNEHRDISKKKDIRYYSGNRDIRFISNKKLVSFMEVKHHNPFPELVINFIGLVNELKPSCMKKNEKSLPYHIAPSLMVSGQGKHIVNDIKQSFEERYDVNLFYGLFTKPSKVYKGRSNIVRI